MGSTAEALRRLTPGGVFHLFKGIPVRLSACPRLGADVFSRQLIDLPLPVNNKSKYR